MNLEGATIIDGFPTVGLVSTIAANFLIGVLKLDQICAMDSDLFPPVSMIYACKPKFPARIYADDDAKVVVFLSEFTPTASLARPIANAILSWAIENKCSRIISPEGLALPHDDSLGIENDSEPEVRAVCSSDRARADVEGKDIEPLDTGIITGVSAILLNEGRRFNFDIISLLVGVRPNIPDARAAAKIIEAINKFIPLVDIDAAPLYKEAEGIEKYLRKLRAQAKPAETALPQQMYG